MILKKHVIFFFFKFLMKICRRHDFMSDLKG